MIVVTGVHRSGTSLVAMLLDALGLDFGPPSAFYPADRWNERGYFERRDVIDMNSRIITGFARTSGYLSPLLSQARYLSTPGPSSIRRRASRMRESLRTLAREVGPLAVKDPRFCLTLDLWMAETSVDACVVCIRHPTEVALSLRRRQRIPTVLGYRFWDYHASALLDSLPERTLLVDHAALHSPSAVEEVARVGEFFRGSVDGVSPREALTSVFSPKLRHVDPGGRRLEIPARTQDLWNRLERLRLEQV